MSNKKPKTAASKVIALRLDEDEMSAITKKAKAVGLSPGQFARRAALGAPIDAQQSLREAVASLLQAVAVAANSGASPELQRRLREIAHSGLEQLRGERL